MPTPTTEMTKILGTQLPPPTPLKVDTCYSYAVRPKNDISEKTIIVLDSIWLMTGQGIENLYQCGSVSPLYNESFLFGEWKIMKGAVVPDASPQWGWEFDFYKDSDLYLQLLIGSVGMSHINHQDNTVVDSWTALWNFQGSSFTTSFMNGNDSYHWGKVLWLGANYPNILLFRKFTGWSSDWYVLKKIY